MGSTPTKGTEMEPTWHDHVDFEKPLDEQDVWQAIADANGLDYSEIADGDILDWL